MTVTPIIRNVLLGALLSAGATGAIAQDVEGAIKARKAHMQLYSHHLGILGGMAKGETEYNAELAASVAGDLAKLTTLMQASYWPAGSDNSNNPNTRLLPKAWDNMNDIIKISQDLGAASATLASAAGNGLEALQGAMGPVGQSCGACHKPYRAPKK